LEVNEVTEVKGEKAMKRYLLLAGIATAFAIAPTAASADVTDGYVSYNNYVSTTLVNGSFDFDLTGMFGGVLIRGTIDPDSAAHAVTDAKQIQSYETVEFDPNLGQLFDGDGATVDNDADSGNVSATGNVGVNVAAGQYNMQQNSGNLSVSGNADPNASGGWSSAATTAYQSLSGTSYGAATFDIYDFSIPLPYSDDNDADSGTVSGSGNIGVNVAAGAFNQQQNLLTLAVANNSVLSQSTAALWQTASCNYISIQNQDNDATSGTVSGSGNIGVNVAAGVGNQQMNSLTAANSNSTGM
jgi:hypothetical protein